MRAKARVIQAANLFRGAGGARDASTVATVAQANRRAALRNWEQAASEARAAGRDDLIERWRYGGRSSWTEIDARARELRKELGR